MIVSRVVQGAGLALMFPSAIGILFSHAPQEKRAKYMAMFFAITGGMTAIGPIAGSYLITFSWRAVFFINLPLAIAAVSLIWALTPADGSTGLAAGLASMDWPGAVLVALAMASLIIPLQQGGTVGWTDVRIIGGLLCSVILFLAFGIHESRTTRPIITIGVFRSARFSLSALATLAASMAFIPVMYFVSVYGELALDQNVLHASEFILYFFIGFMVAAQIGARIFDAHGIRRVLLVAGLLSIIGFGRLHAIAGGLDAGVPPVSALTVPLMLSGAGIGKRNHLPHDGRGGTGVPSHRGVLRARRCPP
jgi:MFS family permease